MWGSIVSAGIGAVGSAIGQRNADRRAQANSREQMAFQERMSSTALQRSAIDHEKAGLNRILALGSPASTPGGASAGASNQLAELQQNINSAYDNKVKTATLKNLGKTGKLIDAQAYATTQQGRLNANKANVTTPLGDIADGGWRMVKDYASRIPDMINNSAKSWQSSPLNPSNYPSSGKWLPHRKKLTKWYKGAPPGVYLSPDGKRTLYIGDSKK